MNAEAIIRGAVEEEMMKHALISFSKKCSCGEQIAPYRSKQYGTLHLQHAKHVASVIAKRLTERATWREAA